MARQPRTYILHDTSQYIKELNHSIKRLISLIEEALRKDYAHRYQEEAIDLGESEDTM